MAGRVGSYKELVRGLGGHRGKDEGKSNESQKIDWRIKERFFGQVASKMSWKILSNDI
jgi:hypothetical protein